MKGLELSKLYYLTYCEPLLQSAFAGLVPRIAAGLVGEGSECFGFDDAFSQDHDWGAAVCLWLDKDDMAAHGKALTAGLATLPSGLAGYPARTISPWGGGRVGVLEISGFYYRHLGRDTPPQTACDWLRLPESRLATATNGQVFADPAGRFSAFRNALLAYYPEDVRLKKLAARLAGMAQTGQYNYPRSLARKEYATASMISAAFMRETAGAVHLLNRRYAPYYKWLHRSLAGLPLLGARVAACLTAMAAPGHDDVYECGLEAMRTICGLVASVMLAEGLSQTTSESLLEHALAVQRSIEHEELRNLDLFLG